VPRVVGLKLRKAKTRIVRAHCKVGQVTRKFSSQHKRGRVLAQKPGAGKTLPKNSRVNMTVGKGPEALSPEHSEGRLRESRPLGLPDTDAGLVPAESGC
jgi:beta-lactam-binding protein with PASTA domain